jgi:hypothetical protein
MKRKKTKTIISISVDRNMNVFINENITNKSKYVEWLIYQDLKNSMSEDRMKKIII